MRGAEKRMQAGENDKATGAKLKIFALHISCANDKILA
jgi:hypothetical protein